MSVGVEGKRREYELEEMIIIMEETIQNYISS